MNEKILFSASDVIDLIKHAKEKYEKKTIKLTKNIDDELQSNIDLTLSSSSIKLLTIIDENFATGISFVQIKNAIKEVNLNYNNKTNQFVNGFYQYIIKLINNNLKGKRTNLPRLTLEDLNDVNAFANVQITQTEAPKYVPAYITDKDNLIK